MSQAKASDKPAPAAGPGITASVGLGISCSQRLTSMRARKSVTLWSKVNVTGAPAAFLAKPFTSPPEQKAWPVPVSTTSRTAGSAAKRGRASASASIISRLKALRASGRFIVSVAMPPLMVSSRSWVMSSSSVGWFGLQFGWLAWFHQARSEWARKSSSKVQAERCWWAK